MRIISIFFTLLLLFLTFSFAIAKETHLVTITQIVDHPSLNDVRNGIISSLKEKGFEEGNNLKIISENAQGNITTSMQIAKKFVSLNPDVVVTISTPSSQSAVTATHGTNIPIVFAAVSDPLYAKLIKDVKDTKRNITGVTDTQPLEEQLKLITEILPNIKKLGIIYNNGEANSVKIVNDIKSKNTKFQIIEVTASKSNDVSSAATKLVSAVDAIFVPLDNTVVSALQALLKVTDKYKIPVFSSDPDLVSQGVLASTGVSHQEVGKLAGTMVANILNGSKASDIEITAPEKINTYINTKKANILDIKIKDDILKKAEIKF
jgi:putative tryptophan/tyrosine transport system substrate-binding protein